MSAVEVFERQPVDAFRSNQRQPGRALPVIFASNTEAQRFRRRWSKREILRSQRTEVVTKNSVRFNT